jgi:hypothetical protein
MTSISKDEGVIAVLLKRFENERWPRAQALKAKVDKGEVLDEADLDYLELILSDSQQVMGLVQRYPKYAPLAKGIIVMYTDIMSKSQENSASK